MLRTFQIACNRCGVKGRFGPLAADVRFSAQHKDHWRVATGEDVCPTCLVKDQIDKGSHLPGSS